MVDYSKTMGIVMTAFLIILLGIVFLAQTADQVQTSAKQYATDTLSLADARMRDDVTGDINESYTFHLTYGCPSAIGDWRDALSPGECSTEILSVTNITGDTLLAANYTAYADATNCTGVGGVAEQGDINFTNSSGLILNTDNTTYVTYSYCGSSYQSGFGRTMLTLVPGFFALAILVSIAFVIFWVLRNEGVDI